MEQCPLVTGGQGTRKQETRNKGDTMNRTKAIAERFVKNLHYYDYTDEIKEERDEANGTVITTWRLPYDYLCVAELITNVKTGQALYAINAQEKKQRIRARVLLKALGLDNVSVDAKGRFVQGDTILAKGTLYLNARTMGALNDTTYEAAYNYMLAEQFIYGEA